MNRHFTLLAAYGLAILFFIQLAGTLVESIYILDLMNARLDEKALGLLFYFAPILVFPLFTWSPRKLSWILSASLVVTRGVLPYLDTSNRMLASGLGTTAVLSLLLLLISARSRMETESHPGLWGSAGLGLAVGLSVLLRTLGSGLDLSLTPGGGWIGWILVIVLAGVVAELEWTAPLPERRRSGQVTGALMGIILVLALVWFSFSAPSVIARWTEGDYTLIVITVSLLATGWTWIAIARPQLVERIGRGGLLLWNLLFALSLALTLLLQRVPYPPAPDSPPVEVTFPGLFLQLALGFMLLSFPVLCLDMRLFLDQMARAAPSPRDLVPGFLLGTLFMVALIFINIFSNVWGYVPPVSPVFRGTFWLAYVLLAAGITLLALRMNPTGWDPTHARRHRGWGLFLAVLFLVTAGRAAAGGRVQAEADQRASLIVMTFNTQQSNDETGERSFERQLALMRQVSPDIIALQESDSARISLNNNDYVRYFAEQLGYASYYGPTPVSGTFGTAILSRYPLQNTRTVFSFSSADEIGTAEAEIEVDGRRFTIYNVHPAGSEAAKLAFARTLLDRSQDKPYVIALGDYNLRDYEEAYQMIDRVYTNAWTGIHPTGISPDGLDMSGENRIDHIFVSPNLGVRNPVYLLPPDSATDHPVHWVEVYWDTP